MATRKTSAPAEDIKQHIEQVMNSANNAFSAPTTGVLEETEQARPTAVRLNQREYTYLKTVFENHGKGLKISTGIKMLALWGAQMIEDGAMSISRAGIIDKRQI
ncbi:MAG: hypothetical protein Ta2C_10720 [Candidatus Endomicrobiellum trichonymphae]|uniref:hypothetical protein n=1 Tax=Endomicrobium trichonymphae TaxID=1408204 RepID=UPI0027D38907|nr:MAG: hypothetical protein Ta2C_10720 [Candidatus Endomicrobium trichonymphae]